MAIINTSKNTYKPAPKPAPPKTTAYIPKYVPPPKPVPKPAPKPPTTTAKPAPTYTAPKPTPKPAPISSSTAAEIKRKAQAGIPMDSPTPEKLALYNQYKPSTPKAPAGKMQDIYKDTHKPVTPPKPVYKPSPSLKAPVGKMEDIYKDMHKPVTPPPKVAPKTTTSKPTYSQPTYTAPKNNYPTVTMPKSPTVNTPPPVVAKPKPVPQQPTYAPTPYVPKVRDENGTVGPTDNGHHNWNSNQSIPDYGSMTPDMIQDMIGNLTGGGKQYDPATDPAYQAVLHLAKKQADAQGLEAMEIMNERGILNSTVTSDRVGQIKQGASDAAIGTIPGLSANFINQQNNNQQNYQALLNSVMGGAQWQQDFAEGNRRFDKGYQLDEADVTGVYTPAEAIAKGYNVGTGIQTLEAQGQYADQALAKQKLQFEKDSFDREMNFTEQDSYIQNDLKARGLDLEELKIGIDRFAAESDAEYKQRQISSDTTAQESKTNTNRAIGNILRVGSAAEGFAYIHSQTNAWASSGVDFRDVIDALESKFPGATSELMDDGDYRTP